MPYGNYRLIEKTIATLEFPANNQIKIFVHLNYTVCNYLNHRGRYL